MTKKQYHVALQHDAEEKVWYAELEEEPRVHTFGRSLAAALEHIADATALWFECGPDDLDLVPRPPLPEADRALVSDAIELRAAAERARHQAGEATVGAAVALAGQGYSRRDIAALLGLSHQRVQQVIEAAPATAARQLG